MPEGHARPVPPVPGFPELRDVAVAWAPLPGPGDEREMRHTAGSWRPTIPCGNPACRGGGFDVGSLVEGMVSFREEAKSGLLVCSGWEAEEIADPEAGIPCVRSIRYRLSLIYRTSPPNLRGAPPPSRGGGA